MLERDWLLWGELDLRAVRSPELRPVAARLYGRYHDFLAGPIAAGVQSGEFAPCDPREVADLAIAMIDGHGGRALINDPALILADEPTGNLDSRNGMAVVGLLGQLNRDDRRTIVIATHSDLADSLATRQIRIRDGALTDPTCDG